MHVISFNLAINIVKVPDVFQKMLDFVRDTKKKKISTSVSTYFQRVLMPVWNMYPFKRRSVPGVLWKDWLWPPHVKELTHWKRLWCCEGVGAGGQGDDRGWDGWMASLTGWTWVWVNSGSWWWTGRPGMLQFMGSQRVEYDWATELNWTELMKHVI